MGIWSSIKKAVKKVVKAVKTVVTWVRAAARIGLRVFAGLVSRVKNVIGEIVTGGALRKKMRVQILILRDELGNPLIQPADFDMAIKNAIGIFSSEFKIDLLPYGRPLTQTLPDAAPKAALDVRCDEGAFADEFGEAGNYFAANLAGWVGIPISLSFPVTVFVVRKIRDKIGCSIPIVDYVTIASTPAAPGSTLTGVNAPTTLAHELAHTCLLTHRDNDPQNLLYPSEPRGTSTTWWQRRVARTSRHCTFT